MNYSYKNFNTLLNRYRNIISVLLVFLSFVLLYPGLTLPIITINASISFLNSNFELFNETRSIIQSINSLYETKDYFVANLIILFSIIVPFIKAGLLFSCYFIKSVWRTRLFSFVSNISKWAMADVFVVGIFIAFLSANATANLSAIIQPGFYYFAAYCLVSLLALQFMDIKKSI
ncbi:hypothetical protein DID75_02535 [Candidatus Marinamargulisbacteria bacterium SCGC AG-410-N11]|nr:hypothetical protein DID75_02535 [Candidatus Marinamargulisbacteria bacterium SCGC AG-410-N11]